MSLQPVVTGVYSTQGSLNKGQIIQGSLPHSIGIRLSLSKPKKRIRAWYYGSCRCPKERTKTLGEEIDLQKKIEEWSHKSHKDLEKLWDCRNLRREGWRKGQEKAQ